MSIVYLVCLILLLTVVLLVLGSVVKRSRRQASARPDFRCPDEKLSRDALSKRTRMVLLDPDSDQPDSSD